MKNGYMVSTFSVPDSVSPPNGDMAMYTCPSGSDAAFAQCDGGICFKSTRNQSFPGFDKPLAKNEIICSCPVTEQAATEPVGYQIAGPFIDGRCDPSFFDNCKSSTANKMTRRSMSAVQPVPPTLWPCSSLATSQ